jgi:hypothetical protein
MPESIQITCVHSDVFAKLNEVGVGAAKWWQPGETYEPGVAFGLTILP